MPQSPYALSKIAAEAVVRSYARAFTEIERKITITRIFTCFGNYGRPDMAITRFMQTLLDDENREKKLTMFGDGDESWRDYCHVSDVCSGIEKALWRENGSTCETVNVSRGEAVTLRRLVSSVQKAASEELKASSKTSSESDDDIKIIVEPRRPGDVGGTFADVTKAKDLLDFEAKISLEEGVASVANWYNSDEYKKHFKR
jgi:UDP-glucuronate 4-epimerase